jgi:hypothetical protein
MGTLQLRVGRLLLSPPPLHGGKGRHEEFTKRLVDLVSWTQQPTGLPAEAP